MCLLLLFMCTSLLLQVSGAEVTKGAEFERECKGSLSLLKGEEVLDMIKEKGTNIMGLEVTSVRMEGCGCYSIHSKMKKKGETVFITEQGEWSLDSLQIPMVRNSSLN